MVAFGISAFAAVLFGSMAFSESAFAAKGGQEKVTICHVDQETGEGKTITVGAPAVEKHLANHQGDHVGECSAVTCQECYDSLQTERAACQEDFACAQQAYQDYAGCSLTCTGPLQDTFPQECVNNAATILDGCLGTAQDLQQVIACFDQPYLENLLACPVGPS